AGSLSADLRSWLADRFSCARAGDHFADASGHRRESQQSNGTLYETNGNGEVECSLGRARACADRRRSVSGFFSGEKAAAKLRREPRRADLRDEQAFEDLRPSADESGVAGGQRSGGAEKGSLGTAGSHRGYIPLNERAGATGGAVASSTSAQLSGAVDGARPAKSCGSRSSARSAKRLPRHRRGGRLDGSFRCPASAAERGLSFFAPNGQCV